MKRSGLTQKIYSYLRAAQTWYLDTPERSLDEAYKAALLIKAIEDEHFNGKKIAPESVNYGDSVMAYFQSELKKQLKTIRMRLVEFKASRSVFGSSNQTITKLARNNGSTSAKDSFAIQTRNNSSLILEKLRFVDEIVAKYSSAETTPSLVKPPQFIQSEPKLKVEDQQSPSANQSDKKTSSKAEETSVLPRSILSTLNRLKVELDPSSEEEIVKNFRNSQRRTLVSVRLVLLFIIVPFLTFQISKSFIIGPIVDYFRNPNETTIFLNYEMEERAIIEMQRFEEKLRFQTLLTGVVELSPHQIETRMREKVLEIAQEYRAESSNAIKNVFADLFALGSFSVLLLLSRREIAVLKDFIDQIVYGLSDSAKAFIIILFTDIFVGFHSPHGWEVILEGISRHLGLPENREFIFLFIATFPVILDTIFKYWIFRYLNRISPSAVATYRTMNE
ncbi:proton extrusion protein PcxA [Chroococcidiopsis sp. CCMEE 29]|uniref:proton extrusion protein PcxA n=1 Tax=Chroococcidiopsis sp. CCMEE 29 TaxID=155894 RepID=UPI0020200410|nr:proton extrusion protein PcxA [Chroococcidiopsis sp. CCMEE 29]